MLDQPSVLRYSCEGKFFSLSKSKEFEVELKLMVIDDAWQVS